MQIGYRFRCYPTHQQQVILLRWIGCQRAIYNAKVDEDRYFRKFASKAVSLAGQYPPVDQQYSQFKDRELTPWLYEVPSQVLRNGAVRWYQAYHRFFKGLARRPTIHHKTGPQSLWLTRELFECESLVDTDVEGLASYEIQIGTRRCPVGALRFTPHCKFSPMPHTLVLTVDNGRWFVSFATADRAPVPTEAEVVDELRRLPEAELRAATVGVDRGIAIPVCAGPGRHYDFLDIQKQRMAQQDRARSRWQRRVARRKDGSAGKRKARRRVARSYGYAARVRRNFAHQTSHRLVTDPATRLIAFEDLKVLNMTGTPQAKPDGNGHWLRNGARAKAGLNRKILAAAWGQTKTYTQYKALRLRKLAIVVPPHYSSQECSRCGYTDSGNRPEQAVFVCRSCDYQANADDNACGVLGHRAVTLVLSGQYHPHEVKHTLRLGHHRKRQVGAGCSEPPSERAATPTETGQDTDGISRLARQSSKSEAPTTTALAV